MTNIINPQTLQYLDALLKHKSFTHAAKEMYISQPYLTQFIKKIEEELGTEIINRNSQQLQLTEAGMLYYRFLEKQEKDLSHLKQSLKEYQSTDIVHIKVGILSSLATYVLPQFLPTVLKAYPNLKVSLYEDIPSINETKVLNGDLDFYIGQNIESVSPKLMVHECTSHSYFAIIPESSPLYEKNSTLIPKNTIPFDKLLKHPLILTTSGSAIRRQVDRLLHRYKIHPNIIMESDNIYTVTELARNNLGITFVPVSILRYFDNITGYNLYPIPEDLMTVDIFVAHRENMTLTVLHIDFIKTLKDNLAISNQKILQKFSSDLT